MCTLKLINCSLAGQWISSCCVQMRLKGSFAAQGTHPLTVLHAPFEQQCQEEHATDCQAVSHNQHTAMSQPFR